MMTETCGACGQEVRLGSRPDNSPRRWLHREDVDHDAVLGRPMTEADLAEVERQLDLPRTRPVVKDGVEVEETYTVRELDLARWRKSEKFRAMEAAEAALHPDEVEEEEEVETLPPVEVYAHDADPADFAPRSGIKQVINLIGKTPGWELVNIRHARGPYIGASGQCLSISDTHVVRGRAPQLDGTVRVAVASWRDGAFDFAFIGTIKDGHLSTSKVDATTMKNWIKGKA